MTESGVLNVLNDWNSLNEGSNRSSRAIHNPLEFS